MRDSPASITIASNWARCPGKNAPSTAAADDERQLCPDGKEGWLGFPTAATTVIAASACQGRMSQFSVTGVA